MRPGAGSLFTMMVVMALVTTFATTPLLALLSRGDTSSAIAAQQPA